MKCRILSLAAMLLLATTAVAGAETAEGDPVKGKKVFNKCKACHMVGEEVKNRVGPPLNGVIDQPWGLVEDFKYSKTLLEGKEEGRIWDFETLDAYLTKPKDVIPKGKMAFAGLRKEQDRLDVIAYLKMFNADGTEATE